MDSAPRPDPPELLTPEEMARADALAGNGAALMAAAGRAVARAIAARFRPCRTLVLCGPGNNGGDGYVAARLLAQRGWPVAVAALAPPRAGSDAAAAARDWHGPCVTFAAAEAARAGLVIDAVFGAGLTRDLAPDVAAVLAAAPRLVAVDVPSGLDGATGLARGFAPRTELTITFFRRKPGHLLLPGRDLCGATILADIGLPATVLETIRPATFANSRALWRLPARDVESHKYRHGHVTILGGAAMTGAGRLAAEAARRAGAGLVSIAAPAGIGAVYRAGAPGTIVTEAPLAELLADPRREVWVCGPGLGDGAGDALASLLAARRIVVADADALTACAGRPEALAGAAVVTPHAAEFARVFGPSGPDRLAAAREAARRTGAVVVLKGADSIVAAPDGRAAINDNAPPWLATAGTGDVLAGMIAALLAQGMAAWEAAAAAVHWHGAAARRAGPGMIAEDLPPALAASRPGGS
ncbi:MAG: NAD(P)H-hydrate dehydratase [Rhodospirillales bacterium]|nr:NAD(P)H-hydrate dehydratase [Rhodospirillales bacterium]